MKINEIITEGWNWKTGAAGAALGGLAGAALAGPHGALAGAAVGGAAGDYFGNRPNKEQEQEHMRAYRNRERADQEREQRKRESERQRFYLVMQLHILSMDDRWYHEIVVKPLILMNQRNITRVSKLIRQLGNISHSSATLRQREKYEEFKSLLSDLRSEKIEIQKADTLMNNGDRLEILLFLFSVNSSEKFYTQLTSHLFYGKDFWPIAARVEKLKKYYQTNGLPDLPDIDENTIKNLNINKSDIFRHM